MLSAPSAPNRPRAALAEWFVLSVSLVAGMGNAAAGSDYLYGVGRNSQLAIGLDTLSPGPALISNVISISAGQYHTVALKSDGTVWTWGRICREVSVAPARMTSLTQVVAISAGSYHSLALKSDGTVWAWGDNSHGQLGNSTHDACSLTPVPVLELTQVVAVAAGNAHNLAIKSDGTVWAWGWNCWGQLGDGTQTDRLVPVQTLGLANVVGIAAGGSSSDYWYNSHSLAVKSDGTVWAWGANYYWQLGDESHEWLYPWPLQVPGLNDVAAVAAGGLHSLAVKTDGTVWAWGDDNSGQLGDGVCGSPWDRGTPLQVAGPAGVLAIDAGEYHSLAVSGDNTVWAWGENGAGQLCDGTTIDNPTPVNLASPVGATRVACGRAYSLVLDSEGIVWGWGDNALGGLGNGVPVDRWMPLQVAVGAVSRMAAGTVHTLAVKPDGAVWAWGSNSAGQLGDGTTDARVMPVQVTGLTDVLDVSAGSSHSLAVKTDGTAWSWGDNASGQLGDGTTTGRTVPAQVAGLTDVLDVSAGSSHSLVLKSDGTVWAWGGNTAGQLGDGTTTQRLTPVQVPALTGVVQIAAGSGHSLARKADGYVWAWGSNSCGQLGDNTTTTRTSPVWTWPLWNATAIAAGGSHSLAIRSDGRLWAWGWNDDGQLGDGTFTQRNAPVLVPDFTGVAGIAAGRYHTLAVKSDATAWAWGDNGDYQVGTPHSGYHYHTPQQVSALSSVSDVAAGGYHSMFLAPGGNPPPTSLGTWPRPEDCERDVACVVVAFDRLMLNVSPDDLVLSSGAPLTATAFGNGCYIFRMAATLRGSITAILDGDITDLSGNDLPAVQWSFTAGVTGDLDGDGDVDLDDFHIFEACSSGPDMPHDASPACSQADSDEDGDVDQSDFGFLQRSYRGQSILLDPNCLN